MVSEMAIENLNDLKDLENLDSGVHEVKKRALIFDLLGARYGFLIRDLTTVFSPDQIVPLPNAPSFIMGLTNYRNEIIPVVDIRKKLADMEPVYSSQNRLIKVAYRDMHLCIFIEKIIELVQYGQEDLMESFELEAGDVPRFWATDKIVVNGQDTLILDLPVVLGDLYDEAHNKSIGG